MSGLVRKLHAVGGHAAGEYCEGEGCGKLLVEEDKPYRPLCRQCYRKLIDERAAKIQAATEGLRKALE